MITKIYFSAILAIILSISTVFSVSAQNRINLLDTMSDADWKALNLFFSNFIETGFEDFNINNYDKKALIEYAIHHNAINNSENFKDDASGDDYITKPVIDATTQKFFGIKDIKVNDFEDDFQAVRNGKYYWLDIFEGSPWFAGGQVTEFYDNGDNTFSAVIESYIDSEGYGYNQESIIEMSAGSPFYLPKKKWSKKLTDLIHINGYYEAKVAPQIYNNKQTYKLLEWNLMETDIYGGLGAPRFSPDNASWWGEYQCGDKTLAICNYKENPEGDYYFSFTLSSTNKEDDGVAVITTTDYREAEYGKYTFNYDLSGEPDDNSDDTITISGGTAFDGVYTRKK